jgi:hypothetical protein
MTKYADWPGWLKVVVFGPNASAALVYCCSVVSKVQKTMDLEGGRDSAPRVFFSVMHFVFGF